jgi:hypothetical protein
MKRRATVMMLVMAGAATQGCFWKKKPATATTPPPSPRRSAPRKSAPAKKAAVKPKPKAQPRKMEASTAALETPGAGKLTEILTPEQRQELSQEFSRSLSSARRGLAVAATRSLTLEQFETMELARSFMAQAERARQTDLSVAAQLARRADLLARALLSATR